MSQQLYETVRLRVRPWTLSELDVEGTFRLYGDPEVCRFIGMTPLADREQTRAYLARRRARHAQWQGRFGVWAVERRAANRPEPPIGSMLLKPLTDDAGCPVEDVEVGWHLARACWGQGYAREASAGLLDYAGREVGLKRVHALIEAPQTASSRVALALGFEHRGPTTAYDGGVELEHYVKELT